MRPFDPLQVPLRGTHLVEAGAGTGKTHGLTALVLRLVVEAAVPIGAIALVTFTEAATRELATRVRARLGLLARGLRGESVAADAQVEALARVHAGDVAALARVDRALAELDDATIATIHGFCLRALRDFAFETGGSFAELEPEEGGASRREALRDFWRRTVLPAEPARAEWVLDWCASPEALDVLLREAHGVAPERLVPTRAAARAAAQVDDGEALRLEGAALRAAITGQWQVLRTSRSLNRPRDGDYAVANLQEAERGLARWLARRSAAPLRALALLTRECIAGCTSRKAGTVPVEVLPEVAAWAGRALAAETARQWAQRADFLHEALAAVREAAEAQARTRGVLRFEDLIDRLHRAVHGDGAAARIALLRRRYRFAIVDEFQDTDAEQYAIFRAVFHQRDDGALFLIGDPKQAIYRFRGGDVFAYQRAARDAGEQRWSLRDNWRSDARLIQAVNALFDPVRAPGAFRHDFIGFEPARCGEPRAAHERALEAANQPLTVWSFQAGAKAATKEAVQERLLPAVVDAVVALRADAATRSARIAVLLPTNREVENYVAALGAAGLAVARSSEASVFDTREAHELAVVLRALAELRDARAARAALATSVAGFDEAALRRLAQQPSQWDEALALLAGWREITATSGPAALVRALAQHAAPRWLHDPAGRARVAALLQLGALLQDEAGGAMGFAEQAAWLVRQAELDPAPPAAQLKPDGAAADVEVLTVHKSKGLEWDVVLLPLLWTGRDAASPDDALQLATRAPLAFHDAQGELRVDIGSAQWPEHAGIARAERFAESVRLAYVALTRARHRVITFVAYANTAAGSALAWLLRGAESAKGEAAMDDAALAQWLRGWSTMASEAVHVSELPVARGIRHRPAARAAPQALAPRAFDTSIDRRFQILSFSNLFGGATSGEQPDHDAPAVSPVGAPGGSEAAADAVEVQDSPRGAAFGECLHSVLERYDPTDAQGPANARLIDESCRRFGFDPAVRMLLARMAADTFACELLPGARLANLPAAARLAELEFFFPLHEVRLEAVRAALALEPRYARSAPEFAALRPRWHGLMHGYIDLVFQHEGRYGLIDYKSNVLGTRWSDYGPEALARAVRGADYDLQYLIYSVALRRHLRARLGARFDPQHHFAGAWYLFVRGLPGGAGIFMDRPPEPVLDALDHAFGGAA